MQGPLSPKGKVHHGGQTARYCQVGRRSNAQTSQALGQFRLGPLMWGEWGSKDVTQCLAKYGIRSMHQGRNMAGRRASGQEVEAASIKAIAKEGLLHVFGR